MTGRQIDGLDPDVEQRFVAPSAEAFRRVVEVMAKLRSPTGCPWDREQTHQTLARHLLEETYETLEAIDDGDLVALHEELGDLVLQVVFHSEIAFEEGAFSVADVLDGLRDKLVRRHPHVFGDTEVDGAADVLANWERSKRAEKGTGVLDGLPKAQPALARAAKIHRRTEQVGFIWADVIEVFAKLAEEIDELRDELGEPTIDAERVEAELGDILFVTVSLAQQLDVDPESALRRTLDRFTTRFQAMESMALADGRQLESLSDAEWRGYWEEAKKAG